MLLDIKNISHAINSRFVRFINMKSNTLKYLFAVILPQHIESQEVLQKRPPSWANIYLKIYDKQLL